MKKILVPTDFSSNAYAALLYVSKLFKDEALHVTILHSFSNEISLLTSRVDRGRSDTMIDKLYEQTNLDGKRLVEKITDNITQKAHKFEVITTPATLTTTINKMVSSDGIDLVVMGSKGRTEAENVLMGSTTITISKSLVGCPLLIVPHEVNFAIPLNLAYATDYQDFYQISKLKPIVGLVRQYNSTLHIVHVGDENNLNALQHQNLERYKNDLSEYNTVFHFLSKRGSISNTLHEFSTSAEIDLVALVYHKHAFLKQLFREPVVTRVGKQTNSPTLIIPLSN